MFPLLDFAMMALQNPDMAASQMAQAGLTPAQMQAQLGQLAQPAQTEVALKPQVPQLSGSGAQAPTQLASSDPSIFARFMGTVHQAGITNPNALAAVAATGKRESGFDPNNVNRTWDDLGAPAGGIMSWRGDRLPQNIAQMSPEQQAEYFVSENPDFAQALNAASSPDEATQLINNAWRFKGFDNPDHPETRARYQLANAYAQALGGNEGSTIDFSRAEQISAPGPALAGGGIDASTTSSIGKTTGAGNASSAPPSFGDKLAKLGQGLNKSGALQSAQQSQDRQRPPQLAGLQPQVGGGFARNPQSIEQMMALLGPANPGGIPSLAAMIKGVK